MFFEPYRGFMLKIKRGTQNEIFIKRYFCHQLQIEKWKIGKTGRLWIKNELTRVIWMIGK